MLMGWLWAPHRRHRHYLKKLLLLELRLFPGTYANQQNSVLPYWLSHSFSSTWNWIIYAMHMNMVFCITLQSFHDWTWSWIEFYQVMQFLHIACFKLNCLWIFWMGTWPWQGWQKHVKFFAPVITVVNWNNLKICLCCQINNRSLDASFCNRKSHELKLPGLAAGWKAFFDNSRCKLKYGCKEEWKAGMSSMS